GGCGAVARALLTHAVNVTAGRRFPLGTLAVNLSGAAALGVLVGAGMGGDALRIAGTGLLGGYTTFSTWMFETQHLAAGGHRGRAVANVAGSLAFGLLAVWLGRAAGRAVF
ncbi:MAG: Camphor resistance CrcB protein, partial [Conexibacter sp.]|nr:Camphor resistance CrcB protein [Conexibacter sp.]